MVHLICPDCRKTDFGHLPHQKDVIKHAHRVHKMKIAPHSIKRLRERQEEVYQALKAATDASSDNATKENKQHCVQTPTSSHTSHQLPPNQPQQPNQPTDSPTTTHLLITTQTCLTTIHNESLPPTPTTAEDSRGASIKSDNEAFASNTADYDISLRYHANTETQRLAHRKAREMESARPGDVLGLWFLRDPENGVDAWDEGDARVQEERQRELFVEDFPGLAAKENGEMVEE